MLATKVIKNHLDAEPFWQSRILHDFGIFPDEDRVPNLPNFYKNFY